MDIVIIAALATKIILVDDFFSILLAIVLIVAMHVVFGKLILYQWSNRFILGEPAILVKHRGNCKGKS
jgi:hypothetical protein